MLARCCWVDVFVDDTCSYVWVGDDGMKGRGERDRIDINNIN